MEELLSTCSMESMAWILLIRKQENDFVCLWFYVFFVCKLTKQAINTHLLLKKEIYIEIETKDIFVC